MNFTCPAYLYQQKSLEIPKFSSFEFLRITSLEKTQDEKKNRTRNFSKIEKENIENFEIKMNFKWQKRKKRNKYWNHFFQNYFLPNIFAATFHFILSYIDYIFPCEGSSLLVDVYRSMGKIIFELPYYVFFGYYMLFPPIFEKLDCKRTKFRIKLFLIIVYFVMISLFQFFVKLGYFKTYIFLFISIFLFLNVSAFILCKHYQIKFLHIKSFYSLFILANSFLFINYYVYCENGNNFKTSRKWALCK